MASVLRILLAPRVALLAGSAAEVAVSAYGGLVWVAPLLLHRV
jgi:hypothetical protein